MEDEIPSSTFAAPWAPDYFFKLSWTCNQTTLTSCMRYWFSITVKVLELGCNFKRSDSSTSTSPDIIQPTPGSCSALDPSVRLAWHFISGHLISHDHEKSITIRSRHRCLCGQLRLHYLWCIRCFVPKIFYNLNLETRLIKREKHNCWFYDAIELTALFLVRPNRALLLFSWIFENMCILWPFLGILFGRR